MGTEDMEKPDSAPLCHVCTSEGRSTRLRAFQINMEQAVLMCPDTKCTYPIGKMKMDECIIQRTIEQLPPPKSKRKSHVPFEQGKNRKLAKGTKLVTSNGLNHKTPTSSSQTISNSYASLPLQRNDSFTSVKKLKTEQNNGINKRNQPQVLPILGQQKQVSTVDNAVEVGLSNTGAHVSKGHDSGTNSRNSDLKNKTSACYSSFILNKMPCGEEIQKKLVLPKLHLHKNKTSVMLNNTNGLSTPPVEKPKLHDGTPSAEQASAGTHFEEMSLSEFHSLQYYRHWKNVDSLCWLHVVLVLLIHCKTLRKHLAQAVQDCPVLNKLVKNFTQAQQLNQVHSLQNTISSKPHRVKTGGGDSPRMVSGCVKYNHENQKSSNAQSSGGLEQAIQNDIASCGQNGEMIKKVLDEARDAVFNFLQPMMKCERGKNDSPVLALDLLLRKNPAVQNLCKVSYTWTLNCSTCGYQHTASHENPMVPFPAVPSDFTMARPGFLQSCFNCDAKKQMMLLNITRMPDMFFIHFEDGVPSGHIGSYDFSLGSDLFRVTGVIRYKSDPDHFTATVRRTETNEWMSVDDLKKEVCSFTKDQPNFPGSQVHIVMWERIPGQNVLQIPGLQHMVMPPVNTQILPVGAMLSQAGVKVPLQPKMQPTIVIGSPIPAARALRFSTDNGSSPNVTKIVQVPINVSQIVSSPQVAPVVLPKLSRSMVQAPMTGQQLIQNDSGASQQSNLQTEVSKSGTKTPENQRLKRIAERLAALKSVKSSLAMGFQPRVVSATDHLQLNGGTTVETNVKSDILPAAAAAHTTSTSSSQPVSYLAAVQPLLRNCRPSIPDMTQTRKRVRKDTFEGYVPKSKQIKTSDIKPPSNELADIKDRNVTFIQKVPKAVNKTASVQPKKQLKSALRSPKKCSPKKKVESTARVNVANIDASGMCVKDLVQHLCKQLKLKPGTEAVLVDEDGKKITIQNSAQPQETRVKQPTKSKKRMKPGCSESKSTKAAVIKQDIASNNTSNGSPPAQPKLENKPAAVTDGSNNIRGGLGDSLVGGACPVDLDDLISAPVPLSVDNEMFVNDLLGISNPGDAPKGAAIVEKDDLCFDDLLDDNLFI